MTFSRYILGALAALAAALLAHTVTWVSVEAKSAELTIAVTGATADPVGVALGVIVGVATVVAAWNRAMVRRVLLGLAALAAAAMTISEVVVALDFSSVAVAAVADKTGVLSDGHATRGSVWPWVAGIASLTATVMLVASGWARTSTTPVRRADEDHDARPLDAKSAWKQLSSGVDPTATG